MQNAKLLERLKLSVKLGRLVGLHKILSPIAPSLKVLDLTLTCDSISLPLTVLCRELKAMAGHNMLEALSFIFDVYHETAPDHEAEGYIGSIIQEVEKVLVKSGWSSLRQVSFKFSIKYYGKEEREDIAKLSGALQFLRDKYPNISKLEFGNENFSFFVVCSVKCVFEF